jgi:predicted SprT family Zn-dependent metalloprotease
MTRVEAMRDEAQTRFFDEQSQLESRLSSAQARLEELQQIGTADRMFDDHVEAGLNAEERHELIHLKADVVDTRERLRGIERDFRREIDTLEAWLKFLNIFGGAILVGAIGFLVGWRRRRKVAR